MRVKDSANQNKARTFGVRRQNAVPTPLWLLWTAVGVAQRRQSVVAVGLGPRTPQRGMGPDIWSAAAERSADAALAPLDGGWRGPEKAKRGRRCTLPPHSTVGQGAGHLECGGRTQ